MTSTHCPYCALQCGMSVSDDGEIGARDFATNLGSLCRKGWTSGELLNSPQRLTTPLIRKDGELQPAPWEQALDYVATRISELQDAHGKDSVGVFGGGGLTNEKAYSLGKFARAVLGTPLIDYNGRFCMSSAAAAANRTLGLDRGMPFPLADLGTADAVMLVGANPAETMPPFMQHLSRARDSGGFIVCDPRLTGTARQASLALQPTPGTDLVLALGMTHVAFAEGLVDEAYLRTRTTGSAAIARRAAGYWPERVERISGVPIHALRQAVRTLAAAPSAYILTARGVEQHANGTDTVTAFINLALVLGLAGRRGSGYGTIAGQGNGQGGREHGQKCDQLPGYRSITDPASRAHIAEVWGVSPDDIPGPGLPTMELFAALAKPDGVRALFVSGSNPVVSVPDNSSLSQRLLDLDLLVVSDPFLSETAALADVVFPVTQWAEESGTLTNLEGRVILRQLAQTPPAGVRSDLQVLAELAVRLNPQVDMATEPTDVFDELARASAGGRADYSGISHKRLEAGEVLYWPAPGKDHPGTPHMFLDSFATDDGRALLVDVHERAVPDDLRDAPQVADTTDGEAHSAYLTTGRVMEQYQSGNQTRRVAALNTSQPHAYVELHPDLADLTSIQTGDQVTVVSSRGQVRARARVTESIRPDTVFVPFHYPGDQNVNAATDGTVDPISGMPEFKACKVWLTKPELEDGS